MNPSKLLRRWLDGHRPTSQRETSAILDESRFLLASKLPTTAQHIQNLTEGDIDGILAGGKSGMMERAAAVHKAKYYSPDPASRPAPPASRQAPIAARSTPAAPASPHPNLDRLASLSGTEAAHFYRANKSAIIAEDAARKQAVDSAQLRENRRAAKSGRGFTLSNNNTPNTPEP